MKVKSKKWVPRGLDGAPDKPKMLKTKSNTPKAV